MKSPVISRVYGAMNSGKFCLLPALRNGENGNDVYRISTQQNKLNLLTLGIIVFYIKFSIQMLSSNYNYNTTHLFIYLIRLKCDYLSSPHCSVGHQDKTDYKTIDMIA